MSWLLAEIDGPLVLTRAIHFAASAATAGLLIFRSLVAEPALRAAPKGSAIVRSRLTVLAWAALAISAASGLIWLALQTMSIAGLGLNEAMRSGAVWTVLDETQFGLVAEIRAALAVLLAACLLLDRFVLSRRLALFAALGLVGALAWTGHAGSTLGELGDLHLAADVLHLGAVSAWIGGLIGLPVLFAVARRSGFECGLLQSDAVRRFSTIGVAGVAVLIGSGLVSAWILVGSFRALVLTDYGQLLMLKIAVFAIMVGFAAVNRLWLTPRLALTAKSGGDRRALSALRRNTLIELVLAFAIFVMVGVLGTLHPAIHLVH
ncbi:copper homeostasis membrane protein CopD [Bradyrhizobium sp. ARR65]|uniref:copper homeostasis membrane protein CopD n=1 Tax=Bradyrhizobium sp. ARR65 TaxID=1040989 RepID=UPI0004647B01|nr:copper homeostasis membrane protein CopD [Bradyrhizobium sp. ARR65]